MYVYIYIHTYVYVYVYVCMCMCIYMYIHTPHPYFSVWILYDCLMECMDLNSNWGWLVVVEIGTT